MAKPGRTTSADDGAPTGPRWQWIGHAAFAAVFGSILWFYLFIIRPHAQHMSWYRGVEYRILRLAEKQPEDLTESQWAACLHWTWNLHSNYGGYYYFDVSARDRFLSEFDRRLDGDVDLGTVDWIWDQYWLHSTGGSHYSNHYRPTTPERLERSAEDRSGEFDLQGWRDELRRRGPE
jgi:hypothetical protein